MGHNCSVDWDKNKALVTALLLSSTHARTDAGRGTEEVKLDALKELSASVMLHAPHEPMCPMSGRYSANKDGLARYGADGALRMQDVPTSIIAH